MADFFDGVPERDVIIVFEVIDFVGFDFGDDEDMSADFRIIVEEGTGFFIFVDFVSRDFALDDFSKNS